MDRSEPTRNSIAEAARVDETEQLTGEKPAGPAFEFINLTGDESHHGHDTVTRKRVRTHARRHPVDCKKPKAKLVVEAGPETPKFEFINLNREAGQNEKDDVLKKKIRVHAGRSRVRKSGPLVQSESVANGNNKLHEVQSHDAEPLSLGTGSSNSSDRASPSWITSEDEDVSMSLIVCQDPSTFDGMQGTWSTVQQERNSPDFALSRSGGRDIGQSIPLSIQFNTDRYLGSYNLPNHTRPRIAVLVHQLLSLLVDTQIILAMNPEQDWISFAAMDRALFHASLAVSAIYYDTGSNSLVHSQETIKVVARRLATSSSQVSNVTIAAVALLVLHDTLSETTANSTLHMGGLERMVAARGGLKALPGRLSITLAMIDVFYATTWDCAPRFPMTHPNLEAAMDLQNLALRGSPGLKPMSLTKLLAPDWDMFDIVHVCRLLAISFQIWPLSLADRTTMNESLYLVRYRLLKRSDETAPFPEPFRLATMIYLNLLVRRMPYANTASLAIKLAESIQVEDLQYYDPALTLWILVIGGCVARGSRERHVFIEGLLQICDVPSWEEFERAYESVLSLDKACKLQCVDLWKEMQLRKGARDYQLGCNELT
ncbi:hypothetical protein PVAG01_02242 [Phlyctema vagabunda]|uniref:Uncharacterized protein n=1 Tax=Phlyctema vagabunda TaxID=108571 RepID=A0ABR4PRD0_9HELO